MRQPGRKSAAEENVIKLAPTSARSLTASSKLSTDEQSTFTKLALANQHLTPSDAPLLTLYVQSLSKAAKLARGKDVAAFDKAARLALIIGTKLRLTPQSSTDPQSIGRRRKDAKPSPLDEFLANETKDDE
jgi:hypothetical protein